ASTIPGKANTMETSRCSSHGPNQPWEPNSRMNTRPATTGERENGRSIRVMSSCLPRKSNLAIAQAAATPNTVLSGTTTAAVIRVSWIADTVSGVRSASQYTSSPLENAYARTDATG